MNVKLAEDLNRLRDTFRIGNAAVADVLEELQCRFNPQDYNQWRNFLSHLGDRELTMSLYPEWLIEVLSGLTKGKQVANICDPWAGVGLFAEAVREKIAAQRVISLTKNPEEYKIGKVLTPELDWICGNQFQILEQEAENFDLCFSSLPLGATANQELEVLLPQGKTRVETDRLAHQLLVASSLKLTEQGMGVFVVSSDFFNLKRSVLRQFNELGLGLLASFDFPSRGFQGTNLPMTLVVVQKGNASRRFVAQLSESDEQNRELITNFLAGESGTSSNRGQFVDAGSFYSFSEMFAYSALKQQVEKFGGQSRSLLSICTALTIGKQGIDFTVDESLTSLYIPVIGDSEVMATVDDLTMKHQYYAQATIDTSITDPRFVMQYLNSELGMRQLGIRKTGTIPRLNLENLREVQVWVPKRGVQEKILRIDQSITKEENTVLALQNELVELKRELWENPAQTDEIAKKSKSLSDLLSGEVKNHTSASLEQWFETLPFPQASILRAWQAAPREDYKTKYEHLLHFFEATAEFTGIIFLSAFKSDPETFNIHRKKLNETLKNSKIGFERASFGTWKVVVEYLGKQTRNLLNESEKTPAEVSRDQELCRSLFADQSLKLPKILAKKGLVEIINSTNSMRNWRSHGGRISTAEAESRNEKLLLEVQRLREVLEDLWSETEMLNPISCRPKATHFENDISILKGSNPEFLKATYNLSTYLEVDSLYLYREGKGVALKLLPLIQVGAAPETVHNACYFFSSIETGGVKFVSYHFADLPERVDAFVTAREVIQQLVDPN